VQKINIKIYTAICNQSHIYIYGRILSSKTTFPQSKFNWLNNFIKNYERLASKEMPNQSFTLSIGTINKKYTTNSEGYFRIHDSFAEKLTSPISLDISTSETGKTVSQKLILSDFTSNKFGVISDIDDTILYTNVLSKIKLFYNSFLLHSSQRKVILLTNIWYQQLQDATSFFSYISNSPWNFHDNLVHFITKNNFPNGPIFLRDYGFQKSDSLQSMVNHKRNEILNLIHFYPNKQWILIGDGGERDAAIYIEIYKQYPEKIKAIFIHKIGNAEHQSRIRQAINGHEHICFFIRNATEGMTICKKLDLIKH
jgi:phosphatidate phosphatase APP1